MYAAPMEKYELTYGFSKHSVNSEIWEYLRCEHTYTPTDRHITVRVDLTRGGQWMHADIDSSLHCFVRQLLPHTWSPKLTVLHGATLSSLPSTSREPDQEAPPPPSMTAPGFSLGWSPGLSARLHAWWIWAVLSPQPPRHQPQAAPGWPELFIPCCLSLCLHNNNS